MDHYVAEITFAVVLKLTKELNVGADKVFQLQVEPLTELRAMEKLE